MIAAPLGKLPLFLKDGGIVPLLDASIDTLAPATEPSVVTPDTVKDRLDVVAALSVGKEARIVLADGTQLMVRRDSAAGAESGLASVAPAQLPMCDGLAPTDGCMTVDADRTRLTTPSATDFVVKQGDLSFESHGPIARRIRWDVKRL